jgi:hypothetical protein
MNEEKSADLPVYKMPKEYLDQSFWNRPAKSRTRAASDKLLHIGVGHALSNWEQVELAASILFSHLVDSRSIAAQRAYGSIMGARGKADALRQAAEIYFSLRRNLLDKKDRVHIKAVDQMEHYCSVFIHNYTNASGRRNDIAHGIAWELSQSDNDKRLIPFAPAIGHVHASGAFPTTTFAPAGSSGGAGPMASQTLFYNEVRPHSSLGYRPPAPAVLFPERPAALPQPAPPGAQPLVQRPIMN